ncbi:MAG: PAS domain S-box protein [Thermoleophilia bacterium]|nr:PAS domain S-box protein [Thermoleophilia bacterium]
MPSGHEGTVHRRATRWLFTAISLTIVMLFINVIAASRARADRRARRFFDLSQDMLCTLDSAGRIVEANDAWKQFLGYTPEELQGRHLLDLTHPDDHHHAVAEALAVFKGDPSVGLEARVWAKDGRLHWLRSSSALRGEDLLVRFGGEEFLVVTPDAALYMAKAGGRDCLVQAPLVES